jgi:hypothetical protein
MQIKTYDESDLQEYTYDKNFKFQFIANVTADNGELFEGEDMDNNQLGNKLTELGAVGKSDSLDTEMCCFYIYFKTKQAGATFLKKLNAYLEQKRKLLQKAKAY